jgi:hypothetical protein
MFDQLLCANEEHKRTVGGAKQAGPARRRNAGRRVNNSLGITIGRNQESLEEPLTSPFGSDYNEIIKSESYGELLLLKKSFCPNGEAEVLS